jgi:hypothetical protein
VHRHDAAAAMSDGLTAKDLERSGTQEKIGAGPSMFQTLFPSRYEIQGWKVATFENKFDSMETLSSR